MSRRSSGEFETIAALQKIFEAGGGSRDVITGIGDDAVVLRTPRHGRLVWTVDASFEKKHFLRSWLSPREVGYRSFMAAASDLAAMAAKPWFALSALSFPAGFGTRQRQALGRGQFEAADEIGTAIVGGNLSEAPLLSVTTTCLGIADKPIGRGQARAGEELWLSGDLGLARAGLEVLQGRLQKAHRRAARRALQAFKRPRARIAEGKRLGKAASAMIDVSDGLAGDLNHLARQSGVKVILDETALRRCLAPELLLLVGERALEFALFGGEDYALVATGKASRRPRGMRTIGSIAFGKGVWLSSEQRKPRRLAGGYDHFSRA